MSKKKKPGSPITQQLTPKGNNLYEGSDGQLSFLVSVPDIMHKAHGPVLDSIMEQNLCTQFPRLVDDTYDIPETPLPIQTKVMLSYEGVDFTIKGRMALSAFDREVIDAVATLYPTNEYVTSANIFRVIMGKREYQYVTPKQEELVRQSMQKCGFSNLKLDLTDMYEKGSPIGRQLRKDGIEATYSGNLISFEMVTINKRGKMVDCYHILAEPAIIRYAAAIGKISEFPMEIIDTAIPKTVRNVILQAFLLRRIDAMYRNEADTYIKITEIYSAIDAINDTPQHKQRFRDTARRILDDWITKRYILGYDTRRSGREIVGYNIMLDPSRAVVAPTLYPHNQLNKKSSR